MVIDNKSKCLRCAGGYAVYRSVSKYACYVNGEGREAVYASGCYCIICIYPPVFSLLIFISRHFLRYGKCFSYDTYFAIDEAESMANGPNGIKKIHTSASRTHSWNSVTGFAAFIAFQSLSVLTSVVKPVPLPESYVYPVYHLSSFLATLVT